MWVFRFLLDGPWSRKLEKWRYYHGEPERNQCGSCLLCAIPANVREQALARVGAVASGVQIVSADCRVVSTIVGVLNVCQ